MLELTREGFVEIRQSEPFGPIYIRWLKKPSDAIAGGQAAPGPNQETSQETSEETQDEPGVDQEATDEDDPPRIVATG
jgi:hypothetical protein